MSTGIYAHDNFVRVDCAASPEQFRISAVHETAHFTLIKQSPFGLLCFFLGQDTRDPRSPLEPILQTLEQAFECTNECYARTKELLLCTAFPTAGPQERDAVLADQRAQPYFGRYHMERLVPLFLQYDLAARCPLFPDRLFLMAAEVDVTPLVDCCTAGPRHLQSLILSRPDAFYPDHRLARLLRAFSSLLCRCAPERITEHRLLQEADIPCVSLSACSVVGFLQRLTVAFPERPVFQSLLAINLARPYADHRLLPTAENLERSFRLSLSDCVIPAALEQRFPLQPDSAPVFRPERNVLCILLQAEEVLPPRVLSRQAICPGPRSALFTFTDTHAGITYAGAYIADLAAARRRLDLYPGVVYLYLDDYPQYHRLGPFRSSPVFFRADVPWNELASELVRQGFELERIFLQRYSDSVFFFFGFDVLNNAVFSMLAYWEINKVYAALRNGTFTLCGLPAASCYASYPWYAFRDLMAAVTEDCGYGRMNYDTFRRQRIL